MNYDMEISKFTNYVKNNYDMENELVKRKYIHTLNVVKVILLIARKMNFNEEDTHLAFYLGLFHDLGRFEEAVRAKKFNNLKFDHGAYSNKILFNDSLINEFQVTREEDLLIKKAIYFHGKKEVLGALNNRERLFAELLRDADRTDIFRVYAQELSTNLIFKQLPSPKVLNSFFKGDNIDIINLRNRSDSIVLKLNFIKLFSSKESLQVITELGYLDEFIKKVEVDERYKPLFSYLIREINEYIEGVIKDGRIRQKVRS